MGFSVSGQARQHARGKKVGLSPLLSAPAANPGGGLGGTAAYF